MSSKPQLIAVLRILLAVAGGVLASQAYLRHGLLAWPAVLCLGFALSGLERQRRWRLQVVLVCVLFQMFVGIHTGAFARYGLVLFAGSVTYLSLSGALIGLFCVGSKRTASLSSVRIALAWVAVEALHELGQYGFPLYIGGTQAHLPWRSAIGVVGALGVGGLMVGLGVASARAALAWRGRAHEAADQRQGSASRLWRGPTVWLAIFAVAALLGRWQPGLAPSGAELSVALVQGGVPNSLYEASAMSDAAKQEIEDRYFGLVDEALAGGADLVVMPEAALHRPIATRGERALTDLFRPLAGSTAFVVTGAYRMDAGPDGDGALYNTSLLFRADDARAILGIADKELLVPFGETAFTPGVSNEPLAIDDHDLAVLICFESMYSRLARERSEAADLLAVLTNDAGFAESQIGLTHARQGWSRSLETGRPLLRAGQAGISLVTDHLGRLRGRMDAFDVGLVEAVVQPMRGWTWFSALGFLLGPTSFVVLVFLVVVWDRRQREADK